MSTTPRATVTHRYRKSLITLADFPTLSPSFRKLLDQIALYAQRDLPILLLGESGVGKTLIAQAIHNASRRAAKPFAAKNLAILRDGTLESHLFGHVRGAYTGAVSDRDGLFRSAKGGTVCLDEIGKVALPLQYTLLEVVESHLVTPMGADLPEHVDVRIVFAANLRVEDLDREDLLCPDLVTRIGQAVFTVPPLRERIEDIPLLAEGMLAEVAAREGLARPPVLSDAVRFFHMDALSSTVAMKVDFERWRGPSTQGRTGCHVRPCDPFRPGSPRRDAPQGPDGLTPITISPTLKARWIMSFRTMTQEERGRVAREGQRIYDERVPEDEKRLHHGQYVAIDIQTGRYEFGATLGDAVEKLPLSEKGHSRYLHRIGVPFRVHVGPRP